MLNELYSLLPRQPGVGLGIEQLKTLKVRTSPLELVRRPLSPSEVGDGIAGVQWETVLGVARTAERQRGSRRALALRQATEEYFTDDNWCTG